MFVKIKDGMIVNMNQIVHIDLETGELLCTNNCRYKVADGYRDTLLKAISAVNVKERP